MSSRYILARYCQPLISSSNILTVHPGLTLNLLLLPFTLAPPEPRYLAVATIVRNLVKNSVPPVKCFFVFNLFFSFHFPLFSFSDPKILFTDLLPLIFFFVFLSRFSSHKFDVSGLFGSDS